MPQPKLSVILPTFNRADSLKRALGALLRQTADPASYEVVVVNNNSTDNTPEVVALHDDRRVRLIAEPRQGLSHARNAGLDRSRSGFTSRLAKRLPIIGASCLPRSSSGRSLSGNDGSSRLDLA